MRDVLDLLAAANPSGQQDAMPSLAWTAEDLRSEINTRLASDRKRFRRPTRPPLRTGWVMAALVAFIIVAIVLPILLMAPEDPASNTVPMPIPLSGIPEIHESFEVGGNRLRLNCFAGSAPAIILIHNLGQTGPTTADRVEFLDTDNGHCYYDRINSGASTRLEGVRDGRLAVDDLKGLLDAAGVPGPYLLYGVGLGGWVAVGYAGSYPEDVVGLVLEDGGEAGVFGDDVYDLLPLEAKDFYRSRDLGGNPERMNFFLLDQMAAELLPSLPHVPMVYMASPITHADDYPGPRDFPQADEVVAKMHGYRLRVVAAFPEGRLETYPDASTGAFDAFDAADVIRSVLSAAGY